jgi:hypothetical protein
MEYKDVIIKYVEEFFNSIDIDPLLGITVIYLLIILPSTKKLKEWDTVPKQLKDFYILTWLVAVFLFVAIILKFLHFN